MQYVKLGERFRKFCKCEHCSLAASIFNYTVPLIKKKTQHHYNLPEEFAEDWKRNKSLGWYRYKGKYYIKGGLDESHFYSK